MPGSRNYDVDRLAKNVKSEKSGAWPLVFLYRFPMSRTRPFEATMMSGLISGRTEDMDLIWRTTALRSALSAAGAPFTHFFSPAINCLIIVLIECYVDRDIKVFWMRLFSKSFWYSMQKSGPGLWLDHGGRHNPRVTPT